MSSRQNQHLPHTAKSTPILPTTTKKTVLGIRENRNPKTVFVTFYDKNKVFFF